MSVVTSGCSSLYFLQTKLDMNLVEAKDGEFLPLQEAERCDFEQLMVHTAKQRHVKKMVIYRRPQLFKLAPGATRETAADYLVDMQDAGIEAARQVTMINRLDSDHNIKQEARSLMAHMKAKDIWELRGPRLLMSALQQPAAEETDARDTSESETPELEILEPEFDAWEEEFAAETEAETELRAEEYIV